MTSPYETEDRYLVLIHSISQEPETLLVSFEKGIKIAKARCIIQHALQQRPWCRSLWPENARMDLRAGSVRGRLLKDDEVLREVVPHIYSTAIVVMPADMVPDEDDCHVEPLKPSPRKQNRSPRRRSVRFSDIIRSSNNEKKAEAAWEMVELGDNGRTIPEGTIIVAGEEQSKCKTRNILAWSLLVLTMGITTLVALYTSGSVAAMLRWDIFRQSSSRAILVLRIMTEVLCLSMLALGIMIVEDLQWTLASRPGGVSLLHFIGLDPGTGTWGLLRLSISAGWRDKMLSFWRLVLILAIPLPGVIVMGDITIEPVFFTKSSYDACAGLADFNASIAKELPATGKMALMSHMANPNWDNRFNIPVSPLSRSYGQRWNPSNTTQWQACEESYLMTGGWTLVTPQADDLIQHPDATAYVVPKVHSYQVEFGEVSDLQRLRAFGECFTLGGAAAAALWCARVGTKRELIFGTAYCPVSQQRNRSCLSDRQWTESLSFATSFFAYRRSATVAFSRQNFTILAASDYGDPEPFALDLHEYLMAMATVVPGLSATNSSTPDDSVLATYAVTSLPVNHSSVAKGLTKRLVRRLLAVALEYFNVNSLGAHDDAWSLTEPRQGLPTTMYTQVDISVMSWQVIAGRTSFALFISMSVVLLAVATAVLWYTSGIKTVRPTRIGFPTLDFAVHTNRETVQRAATTLGDHGGKFAVAEKLMKERVVVHRE